MEDYGYCLDKWLTRSRYVEIGHIPWNGSQALLISNVEIEVALTKLQICGFNPASRFAPRIAIIRVPVPTSCPGLERILTTLQR